MKRLEMQVLGRVQGVAFRWSTQRQAAAFDLTGWVRNLADGSVRIVAEGDADRLQLLLTWAKHGPDHARVDRVEADWSQAVGSFTNFEIAG